MNKALLSTLIVVLIAVGAAYAVYDWLYFRPARLEAKRTTTISRTTYPAKETIYESFIDSSAL